MDDSSSSEASNDEVVTATPIAIAVPIDPPQAGSTISLRTTDTSTSDDEALALAAAAREQGIADIRQHCQQHMSQNPTSSYVTWVATLHPENAQVSIDPRFLIAGNPWLAAYEETWEGIQKGRRQPIISTAISPDPSAPQLHDKKDFNENKDEVHPERETTRFNGFLDFVLGSALVLTSVLSSIVIEICATYAYLSYWICYKIEKRCSPPGWFSWLPLFIAFVIGRSFQLIDILLLFVSVIIVESIAAINYIVCTIFACSHDVGKNMHQTTRKGSHLIRWNFRRLFEDWDPPRSKRKLSRDPEI